MADRRMFSVTHEIGRLLDQARGKLSVSEFLRKILQPSKRKQLKLIQETFRALFHGLLTESTSKKDEEELEGLTDLCASLYGLWVDRDRQSKELVLDNLIEYGMKMIEKDDK